MIFDTIVGIMVSVLLPQLFTRLGKKNNTKYKMVWQIICIAIVFGCILIFDPFMKAVAKNEIIYWYDKIKDCLIFQSIVIGALSIVIVCVYNATDYGRCKFSALTAKIEKFMNKVNAYDVLYIFCGDMDVWGTDVSQSLEFKQLLELQNKHSDVDIRIICKHCIEPSLLDDIINGNYDESDMKTESRLNREQIMRIAYFKNHLKRCSFRFYTETQRDISSLRARVISGARRNRVLLYRECQELYGIRKRIYSLVKKNYPYMYEYDEIEDPDDFHLMHYRELSELKWRVCDENLADKIENYCIRYSEVISEKQEKIKRIALVYAETYEIAHFGASRKEFPPFGVMYLAAMVREYCDHWIPDIIAIDEKCINEKTFNPEHYDVIAFSVVSAYTVPLFEKCMKEMVKQNKRNKFLCIAGGYQAELEGERWVKSDYVKLILRGEGEINIANMLNNNLLSPNKFHKIPGSMYIIHQNGKKIFKKNPRRSACVDLDNLPLPARDLLPDEKWIMNDRLAGTDYRMAHVMFSRGCPYNCVYCGVRREGNRQIRYRSVENVKNELLYLKNRGIEGFSIIDDCFLADKEKALQIIAGIREMDLKWSLAARIDQIDEDVIEALQKSGCLEIKFGLETGSNTILEKMKKGFTVEQAKKAINMVRAHGIGVKAFIITGLPGETSGTNKETEEFLREMGKDKINRISLLRFVPLPGSYIYENPTEFGIKSDIKLTMDYSCYQLYNKETNWWVSNKDFEDRNVIYQSIQKCMCEIWGTF